MTDIEKLNREIVNLKRIIGEMQTQIDDARIEKEELMHIRRMVNNDPQQNSNPLRELGVGSRNPNPFRQSYTGTMPAARSPLDILKSYDFNSK